MLREKEESNKCKRVANLTMAKYSPTDHPFLSQ